MSADSQGFKVIIYFFVMLLVVGVLIGVYTSIKVFVLAIKKGVESSGQVKTEDEKLARINYFFGPVFSQIHFTITTAYKLFGSTSSEMMREKEFEETPYDSLIIHSIMSFFTGIAQIFAFLSIYSFGLVISLFFAVLYVLFMVFSIVLIYVLFPIFWIIDRFYLLINGIRTICPECHGRFFIPDYRCENCGSIHKKLVPNKYGIVSHTCICGNKVGTTFFSGRNKIPALCPNCCSNISGAEKRPFSIQLVGGSNSGKTIFVSSFFHEFMNICNSNQNITVSVNSVDKDLFTRLDDWFKGVPYELTARMNAQKYSLELSSKMLRVNRNFSIYDIGGEMFAGNKNINITLQKQFQYCNGVVFILDPFSNSDFRNNMKDIGELIPQFSDIDSEAVINNFINYLAKTGINKTGKRIDTPFSVVITKSDAKYIRKRINSIKIRTMFQKNKEKYESLENARDILCKEFLEEIGLSSFIGLVETKFNNVHYFFASPMGHEPDGSIFEPYGVLEPIEWMLQKEDEELYKSLYDDFSEEDAS